MAYIPRIAEKNLTKVLNTLESHRDVILVQGARQTGKTSLVRHLLQKHPLLWLDLEGEKALLRKIDATQTFEEFTDLLTAEKKFGPGQGTILVIDEAQESRVVGGYVRYFKENWRHQTVILMGSLMARLFREGVRYPVGRTHPVKIFPIVFEEFLAAVGEERLLEKIKKWEPQKPLSQPFHEKALQLFFIHLTVGGLPEVVQFYAARKNWEEKLNDLAFGYTEDFKRIEGEEKSALFELTLKRIAQTLGAPSKLSTIVAAHQPAYRWLPDMVNLLENWMLVYKMEMETPAAPAVSKIPPKRYLFDHGIRQAFAPVSLRVTEFSNNLSPLDTSYLGGIFENAVLNEIKPLEEKKTVAWRKAVNSSEVDFLLTQKNRVLPIEVKAADKLNRRHFSSLLEYLNYTGAKIGLLVCGGAGDSYSANERKILQVPFYAVRQGVEYTQGI